MNRRVTVVDIQHKTFKKAVAGYDRADVDRFLDEVIETLEAEAQARSGLEQEVADLRERISHFKSMEESLQSTLLLAQRTADELKASAHKEADLIRAEARAGLSREANVLDDRTAEARRDYARVVELAEKAKGELRNLLTTHLALLDRASDFESALSGGAAASPLAIAATSAATGANVRGSETRRLPILRPSGRDEAAEAR